MTDHTPTPWFVSGVRFRMNGGEWQSINRYDESKKQDENIACVGYDPRTGVGRSDAQFIVKAVNNHDALVKALMEIRRIANEPGDRRALVDKIYGIATEACRIPIVVSSQKDSGK